MQGLNLERFKIWNKCSPYIFIAIFCFLAIVFFIAEFSYDPRSFDTSSRSYFRNDSNIQASEIFQNKTQYRAILLFIDGASYEKGMKLPIVKKLSEQNSETSLFYKVNVTWPTLTSPKIQTMMTGSEIFTPTAAVKAFYEKQNQMSNIIDEIVKKNKTVGALGSNLWSGLFPIVNIQQCQKQFTPWDYDFCDDQVYDNFEKTLLNTDYSMAIGHLSAIDRIGHNTKKNTSPLLQSRFDKMSKFIERIIPQMKQNDILFVVGDHGLSQWGNHGGFGQDQSHTFLFVHSPHQKLQQVISQNDQIIHPDLTATFALIYDVPIPVNSVGIPIFIPDNIGNQQNKQKMLKSILSTELDQFKDLLKLGGIQCSQIKDNDNSELSIQKITNIQKQCLRKLTQFRSPHQFLGVVIAALLITMGFYLLRIKIQWQYFLLLALICFGYPYTWASIHNISTYFLVAFLIFSLTVVQASPVRRLGGLTVILYISQLERNQLQGFQVNAITRPYHMSLSKSFGGQALFLIVSAVIMYYMFRKFNATKISPDQKISKKIQYILIPIVILSQFVKMFTEDFMKGQQIRRLFVIICNYLLTITLLGILAYNIFIWYRIRKTLSRFLKETSSVNFKIYLLCCISLFNNQFYWALVIAYYLITRQFFIYQKKMKGVATFLLCMYFWCILGYRYDYASFIIQTSFIYTTNFHTNINAAFMYMNIISPFVIALIFEIPEQSEYQGLKGITQMQIQMENSTDSYTKKGSSESETDQLIAKQKTNDWQDYTLEFFIIPMGLFCQMCYCLWLVEVKSSIGFMTIYSCMIMMQLWEILSLIGFLIFMNSLKGCISLKNKFKKAEST